MLQAVVGSRNAERVLLFIMARGEGYATEIARVFETDLSPIQKQLERMYKKNLLIRKKSGKAMVYQFNPRYELFLEVTQLLERALSLQNEAFKQKLMFKDLKIQKQLRPLRPPVNIQID